MPLIDTAINQGPLGGSERGVMGVIADHPNHIWSTSPEDLAELAILEQGGMDAGDPEQWFPSTPMDQNTVIEFPIFASENPVVLKTYKLSTIRWALSRLAKKQLIASFTLHNRRYYGSYEAFEKVQAKIADMDHAALDRSGFSPMTTAELDTGNELGGDAAFDPIGKP